MTLILGKSVATAKQMATYLLSVNKTPKFSRDISAEDFCQLFIDICAKEGVRGDIAFAQSCHETGNFKYTGDVKYNQNNFAGIGATGGGVPGHTFTNIETGILAQAQHLKTYATKAALNEPCVDPRRTNWFLNVKGGTAQHWEELGGTWAVPGYETGKYSSLEVANAAKDSYGYKIINIYNKIAAVKVETTNKYYTEGSNMACVVKTNYADKSNYGSYRSVSKIKYIVWHYTANYGDTDEANGQYFKRKNLKSSAHYFVDDDSITISVPDTYVAWSVGGSRYSNYKTTGGASLYKVCTNTNSLSIELCDTLKNGRYDVSEKTLANAIELTKDLMKKYNIPINNVIRHFDVTGKICPAYYVDNTEWNKLRARISSDVSISTTVTTKSTIYRIRKTWADASSQIGAYSSLERAKAACRAGYFVFDENGNSVYPVVTTTASTPLKVSQSKKDIQKFLNTYYGEEIKKVIGALLAIDGDIGAKSKRALAIAMQVELNKLGAGLDIDGKFGPKSDAAFDKYVGVLKRGMKGSIFVTLWQCILVAHGLNPNGIDGSFGNGCATATNQLFAKIGLAKDTSVSGADINTLL